MEQKVDLVAQTLRLQPGELVNLRAIVQEALFFGSRYMFADTQTGSLQRGDLGLVLAVDGSAALVLNSRGELGWAWSDLLEGTGT